MDASPVSRTPVDRLLAFGSSRGRAAFDERLGIATVSCPRTISRFLHPGCELAGSTTVVQKSRQWHWMSMLFGGSSASISHHCNARSGQR